MLEEITALVMELGELEEDRRDLAGRLAEVAMGRLDSRLRRDVTPQTCGGCYELAAAWLALAALEVPHGLEGFTSITAGDMSLRREAGDEGPGEDRAWALMAPYLEDRGFVFRGVEG